MPLRSEHFLITRLSLSFVVLRITFRLLNHFQFPSNRCCYTLI